MKGLIFGLVILVACGGSVAKWLVLGRVTEQWPFPAYYREENPILFWGHVVFFSLFAFLGLILASNTA